MPESSPAHVQALAAFLEHLSPETQAFCTYDGYDLATAQTFCEAINRYDKLRLVLETSSDKRVIGLLEFSFDIPDGDHERFQNYTISLYATDCRFGPCLADDYQNQGVGTLIWPFIIDIAKRFSRKRIILWGGVLSRNARAIHYYEKIGFKVMGSFQNEDDIECLDMMLNL